MNGSLINLDSASPKIFPCTLNELSPVSFEMPGLIMKLCHGFNELVPGVVLLAEGVAFAETMTRRNTV